MFTFKGIMPWKICIFSFCIVNLLYTFKRPKPPHTAITRPPCARKTVPRRWCRAKTTFFIWRWYPMTSAYCPRTGLAFCSWSRCWSLVIWSVAFQLFKSGKIAQSNLLSFYEIYLKKLKTTDEGIFSSIETVIRITTIYTC